MTTIARLPSTDLLTLRDWADEVVFLLDNVGPIQRLDDEAAWQDWAAGFCTINGVSQLNPPSPYDFGDWRAWADAFLKILP